MPLYKLWDSGRGRRKMVVANGVQELIEKGSEKLNINGFRLVLEQDGTEVENDEELAEIPGSTLILLMEDEAWCSPAEPAIPRTTAINPSLIYSTSPATSSDSDQCLSLSAPVTPLSRPPAMTSLSVNVEPPIPLQPSVPSIPSPPCTTTSSLSSPQSLSSPTRVSMASLSIPLPPAVTSPNTGAVNSPQGLATLSTAPSTSMRNYVNYTTPLPPFSEYVLRHISVGGEIHVVWRQLINEAAQYYKTRFPELGEKSEYKAIGEKMYRKYPAIAHDGTEKWTYFTTCLSQRIRHLRWDEKRKSAVASPTQNSASNPKRARFDASGDSGAAERELSVEQYEKHIAELKKEWSKPKPSLTHIKVLMQESFRNRRQWIATLPNGQVKEILDTFPCFVQGKFLMVEFLQLTKKDVTAMLEKMKKMYENLLVIVSTKPKGTSTEKFIAVWKWLEAQTSYNRGHGQKTVNVIDVKKDIPHDRLEAVTKSSQKSPPKLVLLLDAEGNLSQSVVTGDGGKIYYKGNVFEAVLLLLATYYITDLDYPKMYCNVLGVVQQFVVGEPYVGEKSSNYKIFLRKHETLFN